MAKQISFINSKTGSGKTEFLIKQVGFSKNNSLIVAPNKKLCDEIEQRLVKSGQTDVITLHQDTIKNPINELKDKMKTREFKTIVTTHASFITAFAETLSNEHTWDLVIDEDLSPVIENELYISQCTIQLFLSLFKFEADKTNEEFMVLSPRSKALKNAIESKTIIDHILDNHHFRKLAKNVISEEMDCKMTKKMYDRLLEAEQSLSDNKDFKVTTVSFVKKASLMRFQNITISSSMYEKTLSYKVFEKMGIEMKQQDFQEYHSRTDYSNVEIKYFTDGNWSKKLRLSKHEGATMQEFISRIITKELGSEKYIFNANIDSRDMFNFNGTLVTNIHGVNNHSGVTNVVYMPSLNASGEFVNFMSSLGVGRNDIDFDRNVLSAYQFASRSAIRDPNNKEKVRIYVMDKRTAMFLQETFTGSSVKFHTVKKMKTKIPPNIRSFVSRVRSRMKNDEYVRHNTLKKYNDIMKKYYGKTI